MNYKILFFSIFLITIPCNSYFHTQTKYHRKRLRSTMLDQKNKETLIKLDFLYNQLSKEPPILSSNSKYIITLTSLCTTLLIVNSTDKFIIPFLANYLSIDPKTKTLLEIASENIFGKSKTIILNIASIFVALIISKLIIGFADKSKKPNLHILENFIKKWEIHKMLTPKKYHDQFQILNECYKAAGNKLKIKEQTAKKIIIFMLSEIIDDKISI